MQHFSREHHHPQGSIRGVLRGRLRGVGLVRPPLASRACLSRSFGRRQRSPSLGGWNAVSLRPALLGPPSDCRPQTARRRHGLASSPRRLGNGGNGLPLPLATRGAPCGGSLLGAERLARRTGGAPDGAQKFRAPFNSASCCVGYGAGRRRHLGSQGSAGTGLDLRLALPWVSLCLGGGRIDLQGTAG